MTHGAALIGAHAATGQAVLRQLNRHLCKGIRANTKLLDASCSKVVKCQHLRLTHGSSQSTTQPPQWCGLRTSCSSDAMTLLRSAWQSSSASNTCGCKRTKVWIVKPPQTANWHCDWLPRAACGPVVATVLELLRRSHEAQPWRTLCCACRSAPAGAVMWYHPLGHAQSSSLGVQTPM